MVKLTIQIEQSDSLYMLYMVYSPQTAIPDMKNCGVDNNS